MLQRQKHFGCNPGAHRGTEWRPSFPMATDNQSTQFIRYARHQSVMSRPDRPDPPKCLGEPAGPGIAVAGEDPSRGQAVEGIE
jgi:hypothetical protein